MPVDALQLEVRTLSNVSLDSFLKIEQDLAAVKQ